MTSQEIAPRVATVFARVFGNGTPFSLEVSRLNEPRWTSFKHVEFIIDLEQEFGVRFDGADATDMTSMSVVIDRLQRKLQ